MSTRRSNLGTGEPRPPRPARSVHVLPREDGACGWIARLPSPAPARRQAGAVRAEAAVVGAGFTGLAVARRLALLRPDWRIALLDAGRTGEGASGRSSGFVVDLAHFIARMEPAASRAYVALCRRGIAELRTLVAEHRIACDWDDRGWLHAAAGEAAASELPRLRGWLESLGERHEWLDRDGLAAVTGTRFYRVGLRLPGSVLVQPAALVQGLARSLPVNVDLFEESPVTALTRAGAFRLATPGGTVEAPRLFIAANGYTPALGLLADRLFPLLTFGSLTRPLTVDEQEVLGGEPEWGLLAEDPMGSTLRRTRDGRLLIRNTVRYEPAFAAGDAVRRRVRDLHLRALLARYPHLAALDFDFTWGGVMGASPNRGHAFGEIEQGLFTAAGYTGAGIAMGTTAGTLLAGFALGERSRALDDMLALPEPKRLPPRPLLDLGIRWRVARMNAAAGPYL